ncbi:MAG: tRNA (N(6)-L-threonylcarbamoyladenosine(37)-C(2))-methylthiotransferase MtaB [Treponema sp.]|nr:tRNA (N(6)-L-threonylcarbamoyladenosine(37)-C(2))-methylthiotransferase MtaB [Treponema sp.]
MIFSVYTLGCKLNQLETEAITGSFSREGFSFVPWSEPCSPVPDLVVINTCTVTSMAEQKARRFIRRLLLRYPAMCLIITGCYAQVEQLAIAALEPSGGGRRLFVVPGAGKADILDLPRVLSEGGVGVHGEVSELVASWFDSRVSAVAPVAPLRDTTNNIDINDDSDDDGVFRLQPESFASHSRAFLKVQDGCDRHCTFCRTRIARGKNRSIAAAEALKTLQSLEAKGFTEAVISGVNITHYHDSSGLDFVGLLDYLLTGTRSIRLRLSSIEPNWLADSSRADFTKVLANSRIRPHFHLSVQSGSAGIITRMGRTYSPDDVEETVALLRSVRRDPFFACDIIAAFPGETAEDFEKTFALCERVGFAWIHAFPYSPRPGTAAYNFPEKVNDREAAQRVQRLTALARKGRQDYLSRWAGKEVEAVVETGVPAEGLPAVSENYLKLLVTCGTEPPPAPGSLIRCRILAAPPLEDSHIDATAELVATERWQFGI